MEKCILKYLKIGQDNFKDEYYQNEENYKSHYYRAKHKEEEYGFSSPNNLEEMVLSQSLKYF